MPQLAQREFLGNAEYARLFELQIAHLAQLGGEPVVVDIAPLLECARLLYQGPWVAERYLAALPLIESNPAALLPVTREIIAGGATPSARDAFRAQYRLQALRRVAETLWSQADVLLLPTAPTHFTIDEVAADPIARNTRTGPLHQLRQPAGPCGSGGSLRIHHARPALWRIPDCPGVD